MNPSHFRLLVKNFTVLTSGEYEQLKQLSDKYPYSQLLRVLESRASRDLGRPEHATQLNKTAVYATDRAVVKYALSVPAGKRSHEIVEVAETAPVLPQVIEEIAKPAKTSSPKPAQVIEHKPEPVSTPIPEKVVAPKPVPVSAPKPAPVVASKPTDIISRTSSENLLEGDALRSDLVTELNRLQELKHAFEASYDALQKNSGVRSQKSEFRIQESEVKVVGKEAGVGKPGKEVESKEPGLIEEIKTSRKKLKVPSPKVVEQNEIIDQFIKVAPTIPKAKPGEPTEDLAEGSVNYSDNIVSETLVNILVKQGKKAKAIEMLKKLIWKFPQKKAYFAAQIEELKN